MCIFDWSEALMVAIVRPWKALLKVISSVRAGSPSSCWWKARAVLIAHSTASAPELVKNTVSAKVLSTSICASFSPCGLP